MTTPYRGTFPIVPTPFDEDGTLDLDIRRRVLGRPREDPYLRNVGVAFQGLRLPRKSIQLHDDGGVRGRSLVPARTRMRRLEAPPAD